MEPSEYNGPVNTSKAVAEHCKYVRNIGKYKYIYTYKGKIVYIYKHMSTPYALTCNVVSEVKPLASSLFWVGF